MKGLILAGGTGSRLWPLTKTVSKQLLPVFDKPMIYYPIATLMSAGIRDILLITNPDDCDSFRKLLGDGSQFGLHLEYLTQERPEGIAQALVIGEDYLAGESCLLILGDNIFHGIDLSNELSKIRSVSGAHIYIYEVLHI